MGRWPTCLYGSGNVGVRDCLVPKFHSLDLCMIGFAGHSIALELLRVPGSLGAWGVRITHVGLAVAMSIGCNMHDADIVDPLAVKSEAARGP